MPKTTMHATPEQLQKIWNELEAVFEQVAIEYWKNRAEHVIQLDEKGMTREQFIDASSSFYLASMPRIYAHLAGRMLTYAIVGIATPETTGMKFDETGRLGPVGPEGLARMMKDDVVWELERAIARMERPGIDEFLESLVPKSAQHKAEIVDMYRRVAGMLKGS